MAIPMETIMIYSYIPGKGYTVRDSRGRVLGRDLTRAQLQKFIDAQYLHVIPSHLLPIINTP